MNVNVLLSWIIIFIIVLIIVVIACQNKGVGAILAAIFWIYVIFAIGYAIYSSNIYNDPNPNAENRVNIAFENLGQWFEAKLPECDVSFQIDRTNENLLNRYRTGYRLGYRIELGEPTDKWIREATSKFERLGEQAYYTEIRNNNIKRIRSLVTDGIVLHDINTMMYSVYNYSSFDAIESLQDGHLYIFTRDEWEWISKNKICPWTKIKMSDVVLKTIKNRKKIAEILPNPIIYNVAEIGEPSYQESKVSSKPSENSELSGSSNSSSKSNLEIKVDSLRNSPPIAKNNHLIDRLDLDLRKKTFSKREEIEGLRTEMSE